MNYFAIIPAAGIGSRMSSMDLTDNPIPKQYLKLYGRSILENAIAPFLANPLIKRVTIVLNTNDHHFIKLNLHQYPHIQTARGGASRSESVLNGLKTLTDAQEDDWVLVHDAARPFLTSDLLKTLIDTLSEHPVGGLLAVRARDTLKYVLGGRVLETINRHTAWQAQTPQMFRFGLLKKALETARANRVIVTDESSAIEELGYKPKIVESSYQNQKVTYPED